MSSAGPTVSRRAVVGGALGALAAPAAARAADLGVVAFTNVNVVPMDRDHVLNRQTVVVRDGFIAAVGSSVPVPAGARVVDGGGRAFLTPGLADLHVHSDTREDLAVYLANGVTTVLNMGEARNSFVGRTRPAVNRGDVPGPYVHVAFRLDGSPRYGSFVVTTADEARAAVRLARTNGFEFIKVYNTLSPECFEAITDEARRQGLAVVGHNVESMKPDRQMAAGQAMIAHAEEFLYAWFTPPPADQPTAAPPVSEIPAAVAAIRRYGTVVAADLITYETIAAQWGKPDVAAAFLRSPLVRRLSPSHRMAWPNAGYDGRSGDLSLRVAFLRTFVKAMADAGVPLVSGTDAPTIPGVFPGASLHDNLSRLEAAGLSRYRALETATRTPGEFLRRTVPGLPPMGQVAAGFRADLILAEADPLRDLATLRRPLGVMAHGVWSSREDLDRLVSGVEAKYASAATT